MAWLPLQICAWLLVLLFCLGSCSELSDRQKEQQALKNMERYLVPWKVVAGYVEAAITEQGRWEIVKFYASAHFAHSTMSILGNPHVYLERTTSVSEYLASRIGQKSDGIEYLVEAFPEVVHYADWSRMMEDESVFRAMAQNLMRREAPGVSQLHTTEEKHAWSQRILKQLTDVEFSDLDEFETWWEEHGADLVWDCVQGKIVFATQSGGGGLSCSPRTGRGAKADRRP